MAVFRPHSRTAEQSQQSLPSEPCTPLNRDYRPKFGRSKLRLYKICLLKTGVGAQNVIDLSQGHHQSILKCHPNLTCTTFRNLEHEK